MMLACAEKRQPSVPYEPARLSRIVDVLVVHDDETVRRFLEFHLRRAGYHVRLAASEMAAGAHILDEIAAQSSPSFVFRRR